MIRNKSQSTFRISEKAQGSKLIGEVQEALQKLDISIQPKDIARKEMGSSTLEAIRQFQKKNGLPSDGKLTPQTLETLNEELSHQYVSRNKTRTKRLQQMLQTLGADISQDELQNRKFGPDTENALKKFQADMKLKADGRITEEAFIKLRQEEIKKRFSTKAEIAKLHQTLLRSLHIAKLKDVRVDHKELKGRQIGETTKEAVKAIQQKYGLPVTGELDPDTHDQLISLAASVPKPVRTMKPKTAKELNRIKRTARLNMKGKRVSDAQEILAFLNYPIAEDEFKHETFGKTTRKAVLDYQSVNQLPMTGHVDSQTLESLNREIAQVNPDAVQKEHSYRVRGSVRDERWVGMSGMRVQVREKRISGQGQLLAERLTTGKGFFDIPYDPPRDDVTKQIRPSFTIEVTAFNVKNEQLGSKTLSNPSMIAWANFTLGDYPYRGTSDYTAKVEAVHKAIGYVSMAALVETAHNRQISQTAKLAGLAAEDVMRLVLAHLTANKLNHPYLGPEACYAYIRQNLPPSLPAHLIESTEEWQQMDQIVESVAIGLVFMEQETHVTAFEQAASLNLIPITVILQKDRIINALAELQRVYALEKPMLIGDASLKTLIESVPDLKPHATAVADVFVQSKGFGGEFWDRLKSESKRYGGTNAVESFENVVHCGQITENFEPMFQTLQKKMTDPGVIEVQSARDLAKFTPAQWADLIKENGGAVPPDTKGSNAEERIQTYSEKLAAQSERLFPDVALAAAVSRSKKKTLPHAAEIGKLLDQHPELDIRSTNLDLFFNENGIENESLLTEARVLQRVHRIAPTAAAGAELLEHKIHHSAQIAALGKERFTEILTASKRVDTRTAYTIYGLAEYQYAQVLQRIVDLRFELQLTDPKDILTVTYTADEETSPMYGSPNLKTLFGALDYCDCPDCESVYGAPAYLADLLRYLDSHPSEEEGRTVKEVMFERRPDIGHIKLNCDNTDTPIPYIDLVNEVLENALEIPGTAPDHQYQTTRSQAELRAFPEHVRNEAYQLLKKADYPLDRSFDLWQEEARLYLHHLGIARWEIMEAFQSKSHLEAVPNDSSIAGEYWGLSTHETKIVTTTESTAARQMIYWGFDANLKEIIVSDFMKHSKLNYEQLIDLLCLQWVNPVSAPNPLVIERPNATCSTDEQKLVNLSVDRLDRMHRFLRLWRHTAWTMRELDQIIRNDVIGKGAIDEHTLVHLKQFDHVQRRLGLSVEQALTLFGDLNTEEEIRIDAATPKRKPIYTSLFLSPTAGSEINTAFVLPLSEGNLLSNQKAALLAAFALNERDLELLLNKLNSDQLTLPNLSKIARYVFLAKGLKMNVKQLLCIEALSGSEDTFHSPAELLQFLDKIEWVHQSGFTIEELEYLLQDKPDSAYDLQSETIVQHIESMREALRTNTAKQSDGTIINHLADVFSLPAEQVQLLLTLVKIEDETLIQTFADSDLTARTNENEYKYKAEHFSRMFNGFHLLHKISMLLDRLKVVTGDLEWQLRHAAQFDLLQLEKLPVNGFTQEQTQASLFSAWMKWMQWFYFKELYANQTSLSVRELFMKSIDAAESESDLKAAISKLTNWNRQDLDDLAEGLGLKHNLGETRSDYADIETYLRLHHCFELLKRLGTDASKGLLWAKRDEESDDVQVETAKQIKQAVKAKYDYSVWLNKAAPIEDLLREKKRDALVSYLIETSLRTEKPDILAGNKRYRNAAYWADPNDLLSYYLIDVEMAACQLTSRIKQAISSTQMFVQRCLIGLEQPRIEVTRAEQQDTVSENSWKQWKWMKNYRIWEANRKVFLYPENWIEPELRDDKSPFFKELEEEIMQKEITDEHVQSAFLHYIQKVHEVARLDIVGAFYELEDTDGRDDLAPDINILHVIGRTRSHPAVYYYRKFDLNAGEWTAWEKIEEEIQGEQVIPVVYNRQLYLFWLNFIEKPQKLKKQPPAQPSNDRNVPAAPNQLEIQLSWMRRKDEGWTSKRVSKQKLIHPWQRPRYAYNLKPRYNERMNTLWLDIFITQTQEFNNTRFWDAYSNANQFVTTNRYDETSRPWHSSSFVFDGEVVDVKMKGLAGQYRVLNNLGLESDDAVLSNSFKYVYDNFGEEGRSIGRLSGYGEIAPKLPLPEGMHYHNTRLVNNKNPLNANRVNVLENGQTSTLLKQGKSPFEIVFSQHQSAFDTARWNPAPFFYQDARRTFFIKPEWQEMLTGDNAVLRSVQYDMFPFYHPYTALFMRELNRSGVEGLLNRRIQVHPQEYVPVNRFNLNDEYKPNSLTKPDETAVSDIVDFERYGAYAIYNWEIFFHAPLMIACKLSANQRFEEAMRWFHFIFDPTNIDAGEVPKRYWVTKPFYDQSGEDYRKQRIQNLLRNIEEHSDELKAWKNDPFKPHLVARYRPVAYQKAVVMKYIDNLIAWGDQLFRQDSIESINEAMTLYVLAYELLGKRPVKVPGTTRKDHSYNELTADGALDPFGNDRVDILLENFTGTPVRVTRTQEGAEPLPKLDSFYFGIPNNDKLLDYWNIVEDRLFKIRHCMNIDGVVRQLPLFEPPIDPALLVKAAAAGADLSSVLSDVSTGFGPYRFERLAQRAAELCSEVRALGDKLLSVLQKADDEGLALLRSSQELQLKRAVRDVRVKQIQEADETLAGLEQSKVMAEQKKEFYSTREYINLQEGIGLALGGLSALMQPSIVLGHILSGALAMVPRFTTGAAGFGGSPTVTADPVDGLKLSKLTDSGVQAISATAAALDKASSLAFTLGNYQRRDEEWKHQAQLAETEILQLEKQIAAAQVRLALSQKELENQDLQIEHQESADEYMRTKYTNQQLYDWQVKQVSLIYFQSYQMAYEMAKKAEQCYRFEIGDPAASFIQFGYWDSLKKGLLSGERLMNDIRRMQNAYLEQNKREFEITKHVSLAQFIPLSLVELKEAGSCTVVLPEWLFDMDYPGHYMRRMKSVSISIPSVVGPYTSVNCTLSLTNHGIRMNDSTAGGYGDALIGGDERFYQSPVPVKAIATSHGQNDAGMFEMKFHDERFLPFEGAGAVSEWRIEMPQEQNQFDISSVSDVILHIRYTARASSNNELVTLAKTNVSNALPQSGLRMFVLKQEFSTAWQSFLHPNAGEDQTLNFMLKQEHLPFYARNKETIRLTSVHLILDTKSDGNFQVSLKVPDAEEAEGLVTPDAALGGRQHYMKEGLPANTPVLGEWQMKLKKETDADYKSLLPDEIQNVYFIAGFETS